MEGWIKLYRKFIKWEWYQDGNTMRVFLHLLLTANYEDKRWQGIEIKRGQVLTGRVKLAKALKLSQDQIRTAISHLKSTNEITSKTTNRFTIITICNYEEYQAELEDRSPDESPDTSPRDPQQIPTTKNIKKVKKVKKGVEIPYGSPKFRNVWEEWMEYRTKHQWPRSETYLTRAFPNLKKLAGDDVSLAIQIVNQSMDQGWQGLFALKGSDVSKKAKHGTKGRGSHSPTKKVREI